MRKQYRYPVYSSYLGEKIILYQARNNLMPHTHNAVITVNTRITLCSRSYRNCESVCFDAELYSHLLLLKSTNYADLYGASLSSKYP